MKDGTIARLAICASNLFEKTHSEAEEAGDFEKVRCILEYSFIRIFWRLYISNQHT